MPLPASSTISQFDGDNKVNNQNIPPANQTLDWSNPLLAACTSDVAGLGQCGPRVIIRMTLSTTTGGMTLNSWRACWQNVTNTLPVIARTTTGIYTITLPTMVSDEYDASVGITNNIAVNLGYASACIEGSEFAFISASASTNVITVKTATSAGTTPADLSGTIITVYGYAAN